MADRQTLVPVPTIHIHAGDVGAELNATEIFHREMVNRFGVYADRESKRSLRRKSVPVILPEQLGGDLDRKTG
jgi:hypothetical protein